MYLSPHTLTWEFSERLKGYQEAMDAAGLKSHSVIFKEGASDEERKREIASLLHMKKFSAFVCGSYRVAELVWQVACMEGIKIPQDISLTAFDDPRHLSYLFPPVTTVRQPFFEAGVLAVDILMKLMEGKSVKKVWKLESQIIWRESVKNGPQQKRR